MYRRALGLAPALAATLMAAGVQRVALTDGEVQIRWLTASTFHYCRAWAGERCAADRNANRADVNVVETENDGYLRLGTEFLVVSIDKGDGRLSVANSRGETLVAERSPVARTESGITAERSLGQGESLYGLGARGATNADARGTVVDTARPFLVSSAGYGMYYDGAGSYRFDLGAARPDRWTVTAQGAHRLEYFFYFGPGYKGILEEHGEVAQPAASHRPGILRPDQVPPGAEVVQRGAAGTWTALGEAVRALVHASLSAVPQPVFDLRPYREAGEALYRRAAQAASVAPLIVDEPEDPTDQAKARIRASLADWRRRLAPFLAAYVMEASDRGYPLLHPMAMQYPNDAEGRRLTDQFLVGDELLAAPIFAEGNRRRVYFPMGNWTDLGTNRVYPGRQWAEIEASDHAVPLFLRNGSILPLESAPAGGPMTLHYTPRLAAEFFLYEPDLGQYSQLHASPALDRMRLEIDSRKARVYEWVVHHLPPVRQVWQEETPCVEVAQREALAPGRWYYDGERRNLHVAVEAAAGQIRVTHVEFQ